MQLIKDNVQGQNLYKELIYFIENINGDIVVFDLLNGVVVIDCYGWYCFLFSMYLIGRSIKFFGICINELLYIIVYNNNIGIVLVIDKNGNFIFDMDIGMLWYV